MRQVDVADWSSTWTAARAEGYTFFDFLTGVDRVDHIDVIAHALNPDTLKRALLFTRIVGPVLELPSLSELYPGAAWHERETGEMFGVVFTGLTDRRPLLLRSSRGAAPMRKTTVLAARVALDWPGAAEPGGSPARRRQRPPGVAADWLEDEV